MKADNLRRMRDQGLPVPPFTVVTQSAPLRLDFSEAERFAVRSTFDQEDSAQHSFAGQFETLLNVPRSDVPDAIRRVRESYAAGYAAYAQAHGLPEAAPVQDAPVLVQEMVDADMAGVLFTANPTGQLNEIVIVVGAGLGNTVVEDRADTTTYYFNRDDALTYFEQTGDAPLLPDKTLQRLIALGREVEQLFSAPMDVEYAVRGDKVWLLQARPITTLPGGETIVLDSSNIVESYPNLTLPLSQTFVKEIYYRIFKSLLLEVTHRHPIVDALDGEIRDMVDMANGRVYYRISSWYGVLRLMPFSRFFIRVWQQMLGVENPTVTATERRVPASVKATLGFELIRCVLRTPKRMDELCGFYDRYAAELDQRLAAVLRDSTQNKTPQLLQIYHSMLDDILARWHVTLINDVYAFLFTYLAGKRNKAALADVRDLESMQPVRHMLALVDTARAHGMDSDAYRTAKEAFIASYGDRCLGELKLETHTYRTHPALIDDFVRARLDSPPQPERPAAAPGKQRAGFFAKRAKTGIRNRERSRMDRTRIFGTIRTIFRAVGEELYSAGRIDDPEDVFYIPIPELEADADDLRETVRQKKAEYAMYAALPAFSRLVFDGAIVNKRVQNLQTERLRGSDTLTGVSAALGKVTTEALVVTDPDLSIDTRGKILVTRSTDPGWVFLIENAAGIIAEKGSLLSHTAIITRELGKPSMVNVRDACTRIRTGDLVELNSTAGTIRILNRTD